MGMLLYGKELCGVVCHRSGVFFGSFLGDRKAFLAREILGYFLAYPMPGAWSVVFSFVAVTRRF